MTGSAVRAADRLRVLAYRYGLADHEAILRFFEKAMWHCELKMLKPYTHSRATGLARRLDIGPDSGEVALARVF